MSLTWNQLFALIHLAHAGDWMTIEEIARRLHTSIAGADALCRHLDQDKGLIFRDPDRHGGQSSVFRYRLTHAGLIEMSHQIRDLLPAVRRATMNDKSGNNEPLGEWTRRSPFAYRILDLLATESLPGPEIARQLQTTTVNVRTRLKLLENSGFIERASGSAPFNRFDYAITESGRVYMSSVGNAAVQALTSGATLLARTNAGKRALPQRRIPAARRFDHATLAGLPKRLSLAESMVLFELCVARDLEMVADTADRRGQAQTMTITLLTQLEKKGLAARNALQAHSTDTASCVWSPTRAGFAYTRAMGEFLYKACNTLLGPDPVVGRPSGGLPLDSSVETLVVLAVVGDGLSKWSDLQRHVPGLRGETLISLVESLRHDGLLERSRVPTLTGEGRRAAEATARMHRGLIDEAFGIAKAELLYAESAVTAPVMQTAL